MSEREAPRNFIEQIVEEHLRTNAHGGQVVTRFPPEPNGYLHIGHAKAITVDFGIAAKYGGVCNLRMDDTNPVAEDVEYVESIQEDVRWLGYEWGEHFYYASDYYERLYALAVGLIKKGLAYVDDQSVEAIRTNRGTLTEPGTPSPWRDRSVEENLALFKGMRDGAFEDGTRVLRAKIDMGARNILMRDPLCYRIRHVHHHRTGDDWCIYPMYDFAHGLSDAIEGVTHSICTLEFENNRELYDWFVAAADMPAVPRQYEFARLKLDFTIMSKRKLRKLVEGNYVNGWDDPRMPTLAALRRRGYTPEAIRNFCDMIGVTKANTVLDVGKLEYAIRDDLNHRVPRVMAVTEPLEVVITNWPEGTIDPLEASLYPHDHPMEGVRTVPFGGRLWIEREDFAEVPPKGFRRLSPGAEVRLRYAYFIRCETVIKDASGAVIRLECTYDPATRGGQAPDSRKVQGTLHWVGAEGATPATFRLYDRLFNAALPGAQTGDYLDDLNPDSLVVKQGWIEPSVAGDAAGTRYQFERVGYFVVDPDATAAAPVYNRVITLRDSWSKSQAKPAPVAAAEPAAKAKPAGRERPQKRSKSQIRGHNRAADAGLMARFEAYQAQLGLTEARADLLAGEVAMADFFDAAHAAWGETDLKLLAKWTTNTFVGAVGERSPADLPFDGGAFARLVALVERDQSITGRAAKDVLAVMIERGGEPAELVDELGLGAMDAGAVEAAVAGVVAAHAETIERIKGGETRLMGFLIGQAMKATGGAADAKTVRALLGKALS
jgi:glutaminyl-tRNA synthetase